MAPKSKPSGPNSYVFPGDTIDMDGLSSPFYFDNAYYGDRTPGDQNGLIAGSDVGGNDIFYGEPGEDALAFGESDVMSGSSRGGNDIFYGANLDSWPAGEDYPWAEFYGDARVLEQSSRGGDDQLYGGIDSLSTLVGDARFMLNSSKGGNDVIKGGAGKNNSVVWQYNWVGEGTPPGGIYTLDDSQTAGGSNNLIGDAIWMGALPGEDGWWPGAPSDVNAVGGNDTVTGGDATYNFSDFLLAPFYAGGYGPNAPVGYQWQGGEDLGAFVHNAIDGDAVFMGGHATGGADLLKGGNALASADLVSFYTGEDQYAVVVNEIYGDGFEMAHHATGGADNITGGQAQAPNSVAVNVLSGDAYRFSTDTTYGQNIQAGADTIKGGDTVGTAFTDISDGFRPAETINIIAGDTFTMSGEDGFSGEDGIPGSVKFANDVIRGGDLLNPGSNTYGIVTNYMFGDVGFAGIAGEDGPFSIGEDFAFQAAGFLLEGSGFSGFNSAGEDIFDPADPLFTGDGFLIGSTAVDSNGNRNVITGGNDTMYGGKGDGLGWTPYGYMGVANLLIGDAYGMAGEDGITGEVRGGADNLYGGDSRGSLNWLIGDAYGTIGGNVRGGNDRLFSGAGEDVMTGDFVLESLGVVGGADTFVFRTNCNNDVITDFAVAEGDKIDLTGFTGGGKQKNTSIYSAFKNWDSLVASGRVRQVGDDVLINLDITGYTSGWVTGNQLNSVLIEDATFADPGGLNSLTGTNFFFA